MTTEPPIDRLWKDAVRTYLKSMRPDEVAEILAEIEPEESAVQPAPTEAASPDTLKDHAAQAIRDYRSNRL